MDQAFAKKKFIMVDINKLLLIVFCCILGLDSIVEAQQPFKSYDTWIKLENKAGATKCMLKELRDSSILIVQATGKSWNEANIDIKDIDAFLVRKYSSVGKGGLIGAATGAIAGGVIVLLAVKSDDLFLEEFEEGTYVMGGVAGGALLGGGIGVGIGLIKARIPINGSIKQYQLNKDRLENY